MLERMKTAITDDLRNRATPLIAEIYAAFNDVPRPDIGNITQHRCLECDAVRDYLAGKSWKDLVDQLSIDGFNPMELTWNLKTGLLSPDGYHHYLPAVLVACIRVGFEIDTLFSDTAWMFRPHELEERENFEARIRPFSARQLEAIARTLEYLIDFQIAHHQNFASGLDCTARKVWDLFVVQDEHKALAEVRARIVHLSNHALD